MANLRLNIILATGHINDLSSFQIADRKQVIV